MNNVQGDLLKMAKEGQFDLIAHGCNCKGIMGAGIALQVAKEFPMAKYADIKYRSTMKDLIGPKFEEAMLGTLSLAEHNKCIVLNLYTQIEPGASFDLKAGFHPCLKKVYQMYQRENPYNPKKRIGFPMIGAGIGGGDWRNISAYIENVLDSEFEVTIVEYVPEKKDAPKAVSARG